MTTTTDGVPARIGELADRYIADGTALDRGEAVEYAQRELGDRDDIWRRRVPARFHAATVDDLDGQVAAAVADWRSSWNDGDRRNMLLLGNVGTGKTHAALAVARLACDRGISFAFWPVVELLDALRPGGDDRAMEQATAVDVLILDDLGGERPTDWTGERLYALVNRRWLEQRPIVATSNLDVGAGKGPLVDAVGQRVYSRLVQDAIVLRIGGADRRRSS